MSSRQQPSAAGSRPRQPNPQGPASQHGRGGSQETHQEYGAGDDQDMQEQYQGGEDENGQYGEDQGHGDWQEEEHEDPQDEKKDEKKDDKKDEGGKGGAGAASEVGKLQHSKFPQDPHHSETMALFHQIAAQGYTEDHVHSFIHVLILILAMLAHHSGMTAGHHKTHEAAAAAHQGGKPKEGDAK